MAGERKLETKIEGQSFRTSVVYWIGVFEEKFNGEFVREMKSGRNIIARWRCLSILSELGVLPVSELAESTRIERSALSHLLVVMEKEKLIARKPGAHDKRQIEVRITPDGIEAFKMMLPIRRAIFKRAAARIPPKRIEALLSTLKMLVEGIDASHEPRAESGRRE